MEREFATSRLLAEILRLQRWIGGETVQVERIYGLFHGFECEIRKERESFGISDDIRDKVEDMLEDVEADRQAIDGISIKDRLRNDGIEETAALKVMTYCLLGSRFAEAIDKIASAKGSVFRSANKPNLPEQQWLGATQYMELIDCTKGARKKMHSVWAASIPREGELVTPQHGSTMVVVGVEHVIASQDEGLSISRPILIPHILLEPIDDTLERDV